MCLQFKESAGESFILSSMKGPFKKNKLSKMLIFHLAHNIVFITLYFF